MNRLLLTLLSLLLGFPAFAQYTNGIYAEFNTSMGSYTCRLDYAIAPKAVANFIGLATGQRPWLDLPSGTIKTNPFYDGTTFHRVIAGFMNQGGSRNALGTDGPGYQFVDEISNLQFDHFGVLAMANSGPDSNGSQFFVLATNSYPSLNNGYTIFGSIYGGSNVVYAINHVVTGSNDKPLTNVVVQSVVIRRVGSEAQAFDLNAQGLPVVTNLPVKIAKAADSISVTFSNRVDSNARLYLSTNLVNWSAANFGYQVEVSNIGGLVSSGLLPQQFYHGVSVQYPPSLHVPVTVLNRTLTLNFTGGYGTFVVHFDGVGGGDYTWTGGSPGTVAYNWKQDPYRGRFSLLFFSGFFPMELHLDFDSATVGTFKGTVYPNYPYTIGSAAVSGGFTASP